MFTGIILGKAKILDINNGRYTIENIIKEPIDIGQSIAHDGACMTIESIGDNDYTFFVMQESLNKTNFGEKQIGDYFNIELCLKAETRIDGHFVSGHIDTTGKLTKREKLDDGSLILGFSFEERFSKYTIPKGSIAINGTSLTLVNIEAGYISVSLIPLTQDWTNLGELDIGGGVNLEFDMLGKYILGAQKYV